MARSWYASKVLEGVKSVSECITGKKTQLAVDIGRYVGKLHNINAC